MTTVLAVYNSDGCVGRCDANCHDAKHAKCTCICGGRNHGGGLAQAQANVGEMVGLTQEDLNAFATATKRDPKDLIVVNRDKLKNQRRALRAVRESFARRKMQDDLFDEEVS